MINKRKDDLGNQRNGKCSRTIAKPDRARDTTIDHTSQSSTLMFNTSTCVSNMRCKSHCKVLEERASLTNHNPNTSQKACNARRKRNNSSSSTQKLEKQMKQNNMIIDNFLRGDLAWAQSHKPLQRTTSYPSTRDSQGVSKPKSRDSKEATAKAKKAVQSSLKWPNYPSAKKTKSIL